MRQLIKIHLFLIILIQFQYAVCQDTIVFSSYTKKDIRWLSNINGDLFVGKDGVVPKKSYLNVNNEPISGTGIPQTPFVLTPKNIVFVGYDQYLKHRYLYVYNDGKVSISCVFDSGSYIILGKDSSFIINNDGVSIFSNSSCANLLKLQVMDQISMGRELVNINSLQQEGFLLSYGVMEQGYTNFAYYLYTDGKILVIDPELKFNDPDFWFEIPFVHNSDKKYYLKTSRYIKGKNTQIKNDVIFDKDFNFISTILKKANLNTSSIVGYNYLNSQFDSYNVNSFLDNKTQVIISYRFIPNLEISMVNVYMDSLLTSEMIDGFGYYELQCLKNFIYAKHNYLFHSQYFQAYFNLFNFYNSSEKKESRVQNIDGLLTKNDKKSLKLIESKLANFKDEYSSFIIK